jgi:hypothetical protein
LRGFTLRWLWLALSLALLVAPAEARRRHRVLPTWDWGLVVSEGAVYDDNVLGFSGEDRAAYLNNSDAFRTPLNSVDDIENQFEIKPDLRWRAPLKLMVDADYRFKAVNRSKNSFSDYQTHTLGLSIRPRVVGYPWAVRFRAFVIPSYYLRVYKDRDWGTWDAARFRNRDFEGEFRYRFYQPLWLEAKFAYGTYYYNPRFTEYDSDYREFTLGTSYETPWYVTVNADVTRRFSYNIGKNQAGAVINTPVDPVLIDDTEYGDGGFNESEFSGSVSSVIPWITVRRVEAGINYRYRRRVYTSEFPVSLDPIHRGRLDKRWLVGATLGVNLMKSLDADLFIDYEQRRADSPHPTVPLVKDFTRHEFGMSLSYTVK